MGNTGSFMVRWRQWKLIVFGNSLKTFNRTVYPPQLFDLDNDPNELKDVALQNPQIVRDMIAKLNSKYDFQAVDREAKATDYMIYHQHFESQLTQAQLFQKFKRAYQGFDEQDMAKVNAWSKEASHLAPYAHGEQ